MGLVWIALVGCQSQRDRLHGVHDSCECSHLTAKGHSETLAERGNDLRAWSMLSMRPAISA